MSVFSSVQANRPRRSSFNLSYEKKFDCDMGQLIPVMCDEVVPGDLFKIDNQVVCRLQPTLAPILQEVSVFVHYFFVPYRLLDDNWESFITGGFDGKDAYELPTWMPSSVARYSLWDYFGFPTGITPQDSFLPMKYPLYAYNYVYNEYYRDENLQDEVSLDDESVKRRAWRKDYFTSALPWQQRGTGPALPLSGNAFVTLNSLQFSAGNPLGALRTSSHPVYVSGNNQLFATVDGRHEFYGGVLSEQDGLVITQNFTVPVSSTAPVDVSKIATFDVADLRLAFQVQKWMERNARSGVRYTEFLRSHFGVSPSDSRLQRPEYIGGSKSPMIVSEVLQTSQSSANSPQGTMAGHGIVAGESHICKYHVTEFGVILGLLSIMPKASYQQGINRQWLRRTRYDFYFPEFAHLSEQSVMNGELYYQNSATANSEIFGYQGRYDEMRCKSDMVCGALRDQLSYWHLGRIFDTPPKLNASFVECNPSKRIFAVQNVPGVIVDYANIVTAVRPIPYSAEPGLIDHS